jgi:hypothetical protein
MPVARADLAGGGELKCFWLAELLKQPAGQRVRGRKERLAVGCQVVDVEDAVRGRGVLEMLAPKALAETGIVEQPRRMVSVDWPHCRANCRHAPCRGSVAGVAGEQSQAAGHCVDHHLVFDIG